MRSGGLCVSFRQGPRIGKALRFTSGAEMSSNLSPALTEETSKQIGHRMGALLEDVEAGLGAVRHLAAREVARRRAMYSATLASARYSSELEERHWDYVSHRLDLEEKLS